MHIRTSRTTRNGRTYESIQLVRSYRRDDGVPAVKVIGSLGQLTPLEIRNLRTALQASRAGKAVVLTSRLVTSRIRANLRYLDIAVVLQTWRSWGLGELVSRVLPNGDAEVPASDIVAALVTQRVVDPDSKLGATRWFPTTALPELLGIAPGQFNNTRLHRVLDEMDESADERLQDALFERYRTRHVVSRVLFIDLTNTWFVGEGPELAEYGETKEGLYRRKVGIVLACDEQGYPVRWRMARGREDEAKAVFAMLATAHRLDWVDDRPVVCDRALGTSEYIQRMDDEGFRFVTALRKNEFEAYCTNIPHDATNSVPFNAVSASAQAASAMDPHMTRIAEDLYVRDLGLRERHRLEPPAPAMEDKTIQVLRQVREMAEALESRRARNIREAARPFGLTKSYACGLLRLRKLAPDIQEEILSGKAVGLSMKGLLRIATLPDEAHQRDAFDEAIRRARTLPDGRAWRTRGVNPPLGEPPPPFQVRAVLAFNPKVFIEQRREASKKLNHVQEQLRKLVQEIGDRALLERRVEAVLEKNHLKKVFVLEQGDGDGPPVRLHIDEAEWRARRRFDGFSILVAHRDIRMDPADIVRLYRSKDRVEKDFQTIKGAIQLRPVRHRLNDKVRAHITLCILALLLERTIEKRLRAAGRPSTASMALKVLETAHLNLLDLGEDQVAYDLTQANPDQAAIIEALDFSTLLDGEHIAASLTPR